MHSNGPHVALKAVSIVELNIINKRRMLCFPSKPCCLTPLTALCCWGLAHPVAINFLHCHPIM